MTDIVANPEWKSVRILERDEVALGGYGGNMNEQATALVARTELLMQEKADASDLEQGKKTFLNTFDTYDSLEASNLDRYTYAVVVNDPDHSKNGYYQKIVDYSWLRVRLNSEVEISNFLSKKGFATLVPLQPTSINYSSTDKTLTFTGTVYALTERGTYTINTPVTLNLPENRAYRVEFSETSKDIRCVHGGSNREDGWLIAATIHKTFSGIYTSDFSGFNVDGVAQPSVADVLAIDTMKADLQTTSLTINLTALTATIPSGSYAYTAKGRIAVPTQTVTGLAASGRTNFMLSKADQTITAVGDSAVNPLLVAKTHYLLFTYTASQQVAIGYTGVLNIVGGAPNLVTKPNYSLMLTKASTLNFDFNNNKIVVSGNLWIQYDGGRIQVAAQEITLDSARNKGFAQILLVNPTNSSMYVKSQAAPYTVPKDHLQVGAYYENDMIFFGLDHFSVNGKPLQQTAAVRPSFGWDFNNKVDVNVSDSMTEADPLYMGSLTSTIVYGWFDQLVTDFPDYVTKTTLGNDATGTLPIHQYRFKPKLPNPQNAGLNTKIPKVMLLTIHNEGMNMVALHVLMREICRSWQNSESLESMRHGLEFVVIPVGNPWGLNNGKRTNSNQIDINRQFPANWVQLGVLGDFFYSGTAALSEAEAQHLYAAMVAEKPDVYFDVHSYGSWNNEGTSAWVPILNDKTNSAVISATTKIYAQYKKKYPWIIDIDKFIDVSNEKLLGGGTSSKSAATTGAVGGTFESSWNLKNSPDGEPRGHTPAINFSTDLLATCILQSIGVVISSK